MPKKNMSNYILLMNYHNKNTLRSSQSVVGRRDFLKTSIIGGVSFLSLPLTGNAALFGEKPVDYRLTLDNPTHLYDDKGCWFHPRAGIVPGAGTNGLPRIVLTMNILDLLQSDLYKVMYGMITNDLGVTWTQPQELDTLAPHYEKIDGVERPVSVSDFWPGWHKVSKALLGTGHTVVYGSDWKLSNPRPRNTVYSVYNPDREIWPVWQKMEMPDSVKFYNAGAGCTQRYDLEDGTILLPIYFHPLGEKRHKVTVVRCSFDGHQLSYLEHGNEISVDDDTRGLQEPSITRFNGEYFLTIRNDNQGFVSRSKDGLNFNPIQPWLFDDGSSLGNYNTQQHWVTHSNGLFLVYTRKGANNDHVIRHRAPLFMAQVDPEKLCVIRETERILVPEHGAPTGNFGVTDISKDETWVTVAELMRPGVEKYGANGNVFVARIHWNEPNQLFE